MECVTGLVRQTGTSAVVPDVIAVMRLNVGAYGLEGRRYA